MGRFDNRVAIVTGGARGIGKATAEKITIEGGTVIIADILEDEVNEFEGQLLSSGRKGLGLRTDVSNAREVDLMVKETIERYGRIDILVNNAGVVRPSPFEEVTEEDWDKAVGLNLKGSYYCSRAVVPFMKKNHYGKIINMGSRVSLGKVDRTVYSSTKAGLIGLTKTMALELASYNINVNYVGPGPIETELFTKANPPDSEKTIAIVSSIPLKRMGQPEDVANLVAFLGSDEASFITGQSIYICGGMTIGKASA